MRGVCYIHERKISLLAAAAKRRPFIDHVRLTIVTPASRDSRNGNRTTAERWAAHLRALGHRVTVSTAWPAPDSHSNPSDALIALHARRSQASVEAWKRTRPGQPLVLVLTGTDLYRDIRADAQARASLELADRLVVLQAKGLDELAPRHRAKARVIHQSVRSYQRRAPPRRYFLATVIGHLRDEKDPFRAARALAHLSDEASLRIVQLGKALSDEAACEARRYRWLGELPHARAMRWLARSHAMIISSRMEGGAHVVSEAISLGVPVIASDIPGNAGLLGDDYPGYYATGDERSLAQLLQRARRDASYLSSLAKGITSRRQLVSPAAERRALCDLIAGLARPRPET
jgi:putative glycosyltransferase (TIGR04348 family)